MNNHDKLRAKQSMNPGQKSSELSYSHFSGPLPPAEEIGKYEKVLPGLADRIVTMAENQSSHRQVIEKRIISFDILKGIMGQVFAFIIIMTTIIGGIYLIYSGKTLVGLASLFLPLAGTAGIFIYNKNREPKK